MATTLYFGQYWAEIQPVRAVHNGNILYWKYGIYQILTDQFELEGLSANLDAACAAAEAQIDRLMQASTEHLAA